MTYVLIVITVFAINNAVTSETRFQEFDNAAACATAKAGIESWMSGLKGAMSREFHIACVPKG